jgi:hypothetical protein
MREENATAEGCAWLAFRAVLHELGFSAFDDDSYVHRQFGEMLSSAMNAIFHDSLAVFHASNTPL